MGAAVLVLVQPYKFPLPADPDIHIRVPAVLTGKTLLLLPLADRRKDSPVTARTVYASPRQSKNLKKIIRRRVEGRQVLKLLMCVLAVGHSDKLSPPRFSFPLAESNLIAAPLNSGYEEFQGLSTVKCSGRASSCYFLLTRPSPL
jgi:hypothetical protein